MVTCSTAQGVRWPLCGNANATPTAMSAIVVVIRLRVLKTRVEASSPQQLVELPLLTLCYGTVAALDDAVLSYDGGVPMEAVKGPREIAPNVRPEVGAVLWPIHCTAREGKEQCKRDQRNHQLWTSMHGHG